MHGDILLDKSDGIADRKWNDLTFVGFLDSIKENRDTHPFIDHSECYTHM